MVIIKQLLSEAQISGFRDNLNLVPWLDGKETAMGMAASVKQNAQANPEDPRVKQLSNQLLGIFGAHPKLVSAALPHRIFPPCFNRYATDESYGFHVDAAIMRMPNSQDVLRSDMSMTTFLSDPDSYEGGELVIQTEFGEQRIKGQAGDAVLYLSSSLHKVTPVTKGQRLAAITWMQSLVPDAPMRSILHELDQSIQTLLSNPDIERQELDRLHHVYHNLIRQHTQV
ncbi:Fe2+-dependent dioxygenase [uncultured Paraglaciecola sp.]|uniref:Fe2+-dependent dioxygenase n=1 Tax=uncultured Paraglaciecola sp. TaxID=1765024 RepID=UPI0030D894B8|tara:strand:- start:13277 stop:13957 length:681 start_codon:yes stop_codon:yes gene_type:complete